jgi:cytochrome c biogenesis protein ResB
MEKEVLCINVGNYESVALTFIEKLQPASDPVFNVAWIISILTHLIVKVVGCTICLARYWHLWYLRF